MKNDPFPRQYLAAVIRKARSVSLRARGKAGLSLLLLATLAAASANFFTAGTPEPNSEEWAAWAILHPVEANAERRLDPAVVEAQEWAAFAIQNPEVVNEERRKDPAVVEAERLAAYAILNARELEAERRKDPELRRLEEEAWRALVSGGN